MTNVTATKTYTYTYGDSNWKDKLTSYNGKDITYDQIGNPLTYDGYTYTWEQGRQLKAISGNGKNLEFKYNDAGIRTEKKYNGVVTKYHLVGDKVTYEDNGSDKIYYTYDSSGHLVSMNLNGVEYYYIRNAQGDIIGLFDKSGTQVVSYTYDTWGKLIAIDGSLKDSVGVKNPYRYRGYRYDSETGLYYLQSRYYNPEWGRFINADGIIGKTGELLGHNLFAYCKNNVVNFEDSTGFAPSEMYPQGGWGGPVSFTISKMPVSFRPLGIREVYTTPSKISVGIKSIPKSLMKGEANTRVYIGIKDGVQDYVGITNNIPRRQTQHGDRFDFLREITIEPITRRQARAIEQSMKEANPQFSNKINSIRPTRDWYNDGLDWGTKWLKDNGILK